MVFFKQIRRLVYLTVLVVFALVEMGRSGLARRTFEFFTYDNQRSVIEDRMLRKTGSVETDIKSYVEELILGPVSANFAPLLTKGTQLRSFMYRGGIVYADFSGDAVHPVQGGRPPFDSFLALNEGIRRNFLSVSDVRLFVDGNEVFFGEFEKIFRAD